MMRSIHRSVTFAAFLAAFIMAGMAEGQSDMSVGPWGESGDVPLVGDFDSDGYADDLAVFRPESRNWLFDFDADGSTDVSTRMGPGDEGDLFVVGDFGRDGILNDVGVFIPSSHRWYFGAFTYRPGGAMAWSAPWPGITWAIADDLPVAGDFDGDGYCDDLAVFRHTNRIWYFDYDFDGSTNRRSGPWAFGGDLPLAGDFDGDGVDGDLAVFRSSDRTWYFDYDADGDTDHRFSPWALRGDLPLSGDLDRDGLRNDIGIFRPSNGYWYFKYVGPRWVPPGMTGGSGTGWVNA